jgi:AcrR family transcriptional regulator
VRVTLETKQETERRIIGSARELFRRDGFDKPTTRDIAVAAKIATGTLFNYFPTKDAIALALICTELDSAEGEFVSTRRDSSLEEALFAFIAIGLRRLRACRNFIKPLLEMSLSPVWRPEGEESIREKHFVVMRQLAAAYEPTAELTPVLEHLYWTLYAGVLSFWSQDDSPHQQETLALLDQSLKLWIAALGTSRSMHANVDRHAEENPTCQ